MDSRRRSSFMAAFNLLAMAVLLLRFTPVVEGFGVFAVKRRYGEGTPIAQIMRHDRMRRARLISPRPIDVHMGGEINLAIWYADVSIGTPPRRFQLHIDTGSHITWVDSDDCSSCVKDVSLETYNPKLSKTARIVTGNESLCDKMYSDDPKNSSSPLCGFKLEYGDKTYVKGYYVTDLVSFTQVSSNPTAGLANVTFGCATNKTASNAGPTILRGAEGLLGLSWTKNSILMQMASAGKMRKEFAHCLDSSGGGILAIGHVVKPKVMTMAPLFQEGPYHNYYTISVTAIEVGDHSHIHQYPAIVDTGTTMIFLPEVAYKFAIEKIFLKHPNLRKQLEDTQSFKFLGSVDAEFPTINVQVNMSHELKLYPHNYFNSFEGKDFITWTIGIQSHIDERIMLGDYALRDKLFIFDLENKQIGWQEYNCSSSIEVEDDDGACNIGAHNMPSQPDA